MISRSSRRWRRANADVGARGEIGRDSTGSGVGADRTGSYSRDYRHMGDMEIQGGMEMIYGYKVKLFRTGHIVWEATSLSIKGLWALGDTIEEAVERLEKEEAKWIAEADRHMIKKPWQKVTY